DLKPYRYHRQRYSTLIIRAPERFLRETFLPEYDRMVEVLGNHLAELTQRSRRRRPQRRSQRAARTTPTSDGGAPRAEQVSHPRRRPTHADTQIARAGADVIRRSATSARPCGQAVFAAPSAQPTNSQGELPLSRFGDGQTTPDSRR